MTSHLHTRLLEDHRLSENVRQSLHNAGFATWGDIVAFCREQGFSRLYYHNRLGEKTLGEAARLLPPDLRRKPRLEGARRIQSLPADKRILLGACAEAQALLFEYRDEMARAMCLRLGKLIARARWRDRDNEPHCGP